MRNKFLLFFKTIMISLILFIIFVFFARFLIKSDVKTRTARIEGTISINGVEQDFNSNTYKFKNYDNIIINGKLYNNYSKGDHLNLIINNLELKLYINGSLACDNTKHISNKVDTTGRVYKSIDLDQYGNVINVEFIIDSCHNKTEDVQHLFNDLVLSTGNEYASYLWNSNNLSFYIALIYLFTGMALVIILLIIRLFGYKEFMSGLYLGLMIVVCGVWMLYDIHGNLMNFLNTKKTFYANYLMSRISLYLLPLVTSLYLNEFVQGKKSKIASYVAMGISTPSVFILFFAGFKLYDIYDTTIYEYIICAIIMAYFIYFMIYFAIKKKFENRYNIFALAPLIIGSIFELAFYIHGYNETYSLTTGLLITILFEAFLFARSINVWINTSRKKKELENKVLQSKILITTSQIMPHFMFNSLQSIRALIDIDVNRAANSLEDFTKYLRGNIEALSSSELVSLKSELEHVEHYVNLEKMRFDDLFDIEYDIQEMNIMVPSLSLQPLVENAIKHGIIKKRSYGVVTIKTYSNLDNYIIEIIDDGIGFDVNEKLDDTHVGIKNVFERFTIKCNAKCYIDSQKGVGTSIKIIIPKETNVANS